ncbi:MAG: carbohydrate ABC transporter permease [Armatimonadetes bacterium]|nr:carbohydrate ABC transporter permease [Candidatus Hippobium faecium]
MSKKLSPGMKTFLYIIIILGGISMVVPFLWMAVTSIKQPNEVFSLTGQITWWPEHFCWKDSVINGENIRAWWGNYPDAWEAINIPRLYLNSLFVAIVATFLQVLTSTWAAYAFSRLRFPGRDSLFMGYLATMMIPGSVTIIPLFMIMRMCGLVDTYWALILPSAFSAYGTFMLRQFFMGLPGELEDAAKIDGCSYIMIWKNVILPLSMPAIATLTTFTFMGVWGNFMWPLIVCISEEVRTLPIGLQYFQGQHSTEYTQLMAASMMIVIPVIIIFIFNQKYFVEGIKLSGLGGR